MTSTLPPLVQAVAGGFGSVVANTGSFPLDVIATRLQTQPRSKDGQPKRKLGPLEVIDDIIGYQGYRGLYAGFASDSVATLISNFIYYYAYSFIRTKMLDRRAAILMRLETIPSPSPYPYPPPKRDAIRLSTAEELGAGFVSGIISRLASTPFSIVAVRQQVEEDKTVSGPQKFKPDSSIRGVMKSIYREEGIFGFWKGFQSTILLCSNPAITLFLFQAFRRVFLRGQDRKMPTAAQGFIGAAASSTIAVALLYPLILIKTRLQSARTSRGARITPLQVAIDVVQHHGIAGLYDGLGVQLLKGILNQGLTMMTKQRVEGIIVALYTLSRQKQEVS